MIVDCSVVIDLLVADDIEAISEQVVRERLDAPSLLDFELASALRGLVLGQRISVVRAHEALADYERLTITQWSSAIDLRQRVLDLRDNFTAYDAAYVALAEALDVTLVTRDQRMARAAARFVDVQVV